MLISLIQLYPTPENTGAVIEVLNSVKSHVTTLTNCIDCLVMNESSDEGAICYMERWQTHEALDMHLRSPMYGWVLEAIELSRIPPVVEFYEIIEIGGLDFVEKARMFHR